MDLYRQNILDHYKHPRNFGSVPGISHKETNSSCGDEVELGLVVKNGVIKQVGFKGQGCAIAMAGASLLTEAIKGKKLSIVKKMTESQAQKLFGIKVNPARKKCATLAWVALQHVVKNH